MTSRRLRWRTRQAASPLSGYARKRRDTHTPFSNFGKKNRQRAKICADPLANSSPFLCLNIFCSFVTRISGDLRSCLSLTFKLVSNVLKSSFATVACACFLYENARVRVCAKKIGKYSAFFFIIYSSHFKDKISRFLPFFQG